MKRIKILTLFALLAGFYTVTAQQAAPGSQKSDGVPANEQLKGMDKDASQPPAFSPETVSPAPLAAQTLAKEYPAEPTERDASMPPLESGKDSGKVETMQSLPNEQSGFQGRTAADPPEEILPVKQE